MWYVCDVLYAVVYVRVNCFVVRGCAVSKRYINVCNSDVVSIVNMYLEHLSSMVCVLMVECMYVVVNVMLSLMSMMTSNSWLQTIQPTSGEAVTADTSCCANCVEPSRSQQWGPDLPFFGACRSCGPTG